MTSKWLVVGLLMLLDIMKVSAADNPLQDVTREELTAYRNKILVAVRKVALHGSVGLTVVIVPQQALISSGAISWKQKRLSQQAIEKAIEEINADAQQHIRVIIHIGLINKLDFQASLKIPDDFGSSLFLENSEGDFVRAIEAKLPVLKNLSVVNPIVSVHATFPAVLLEEDKSRSFITNTTKQVTLVISGLSDTRDIRFEWSVPLPVPEPPEALKSLMDMATIGSLYRQNLTGRKQE